MNQWEEEMKRRRAALQKSFEAIMDQREQALDRQYEQLRLDRIQLALDLEMGVSNGSGTDEAPGTGPQSSPGGPDLMGGSGKW